MTNIGSGSTAGVGAGAVDIPELERPQLSLAAPRGIALVMALGVVQHYGNGKSETELRLFHRRVQLLPERRLKVSWRAR